MKTFQNLEISNFTTFFKNHNKLSIKLVHYNSQHF